MLVLYSSAESLRIPDWIEVIRAADFCFCPNLREVIVGLQREIDGFCDCPKLERVELFQSVEFGGMESANGTDRMGVSSGRSVIDCPGNYELAAMTKNDRYRIANDVRLGTELPREVLRNGKVDVTSKNSISKTQDRSPV
jgi:hypothetical protein